jgi:hypothetical protein
MREEILTDLAITPELPNQAQLPPRKRNLIFCVFRELFSISFWTYALIKLFIFDLDIYVIDHLLPAYQWIIYYKIIILLGALAIFGLFTRKATAVGFALYIIFYPFIVLFYRLPCTIYKRGNWIVILYLLNSVVLFFRSFRYKLVSSCLYATSYLLILLCDAKYILYPSIVTLLVLIVISLIRRFVSAFKSDNLFKFYKRGLDAVQRRIAETRATEDPLGNLTLAQMDQNQIQIWSQNLQSQLLMNRIFLFAAKKIREYRNSNLTMGINIVSILGLWLGIVFTFAAINFGLYKVVPQLYHVIDPTFFEFFRYSFEAAFCVTIDNLIAVKPLAQAIFMAQVFFTFVIVATFFSTLVTVSKEQSNHQLDSLIDNLEQQGADAESFINSHFRLSLDAALDELQRLQAGLVTVLLWLTRGLN